MDKTTTNIIPNTNLTKLLYNDFSSILQPGYIYVGDEKICMPEKYITIADEIENFEINDDDIIINSYPKTGTTWLSELLWILMYDLDEEENKSKIIEKCPFLEFACMYDYSPVLKDNPSFKAPFVIEESVKYTKNFPHKPRIIKTHLPWCLLPKQIREKTKKPKIIYIARNFKDTCVSLYHHEILRSGHKGNLHDFCYLFMDGLVKYGDYISHLKNIWPHKTESNILFITYEQMKHDLPSIVETISQFLGKPLTRDNPRMKSVLDLLSVEKMKQNTFSTYSEHISVHQKIFKRNITGNIVRNGVVGGFKKELNEDIIKKFDEWIEDNTEGFEELKEILLKS